MATIIRNGTPGTNGTSSGSPTAGTNGGEGLFTQNGKIGADSIDVLATGGLGGTGGNGVGLGIGGANGGDGGNAAITLNGNIFNAPAASTVAVHLVANGGNGGPGGTGSPFGTQGKGGNATITASGNIFQPNKIQTSIEIDAFTTGGTGSTFGNATSTINGNIFQTSKAVGTVTLAASASGGGTNAAMLNGNIVQGNINNVALYADTANGTANINGNIVQTNATNTGFVTLEASGSHIAITNNKFTLGLQELDFTINAYSPYNVTVTRNTLKGLGSNAFHFTDNEIPGPFTDTVSINLATQTMVFDGEASNSITGFSTVVGGGGAVYTLVGDDNANTLTGAGGNDTFTGGKGNDAINGGAGTDTAIYSGNFAQYTIAVSNTGNGTVTDNTPARDGTDTLTSIEFLQFADGTYNTGTGMFVGPNHAPVLDASKSPALSSEVVNSPAPVAAVGTLVSSLVDFALPAGQVDNVTDVDSGAVLGIALTGTDTANGSWFYSTNNGTNWNAVGSVSDSSAQLLAADANTRLYFQPNIGFSGSDASAITFRAWDQTTGANGQAGVNVSGANNGGTTAFSTASDTASLTVTAGNTAPVLDASKSPALAAELEDAALPVGTVGTLVSNLVDFAVPVGQVDNVTDPDVGAQLGIALTGTDTANGTWYYSTNGGTTWNTVGAVLDSSALLLAADANTRLYFKPSANYNGTDNGAITFRAWDQTTGTNGQSGVDVSGANNGGLTAFSTASDTAALTITSVNDAPVGTPTTVTTLEDTPYIFATADFGFTDPNDSPANNLQAVEITTLPSNGSLKDNGVAVTAGQFVTAADIAAGKLVFTPAANANGAGYGNFTFQVQDNGGTANGGVDTDTVARLMTLNVTSVNDAPAGTDNIITTFEDTVYTLGAADFGFTDPNDSPANSLLAVKITTLATLGTLKDNGVAVTAGQFVSVADIVANNLTFTPALNASGPASFTFQVQDNGGTANGGQDTDQSPNTITFNVFPVNDAPVGTSGSVATLEDTAYTFAAADFGFTDPNDTPANALKAVEITTLPAAGSLTDNGVAVTAGQFVSVADIMANKLVFTPATNANGAGYASFTFQVQDDGGTSHGGVDTDTTPRTLTVNVTPVNDAPVANNDSYSTDFNTPLNIAASGVLGNDTDVDGDTLHVDLASVVQPANGAVTVNANGSFTYSPNANFSGFDTFTYKANDGTVDSNAATVSITVNPGLTLTSPPAALVGGPADDTFIPTAMTTSIDGMGNTSIGDTVVFSNATSGVTANVSGTQDFSGSGLNAALTLSNIENLTGSSFDDVLTGDAGSNKLSGGAGDDTLVATTGGDTLDGGSGSDTADFSLSGSGVTVTLGASNPQNVGVSIGPISLVSIENLTGSNFNDTLEGDSGNNIIDGGTGGSDTVSYANGTSNGLVVDLNMGSSSGGGNGNDTLYNIQNVTGSAFNDTLIGDGNNNNFDGGAGNDILYAHGGANNLNGGVSGTDVAYYAGLEGDYSVFTNLITGVYTGVQGGTENVNDTLSNIARLKFLSPSHVSDVNGDGVGDLVFQNSTTGQIQANGTTLTTTIPTTSRVVGTGQFNPDELVIFPTPPVARDSGILVQASDNTLSVLYDINGTNSSGPMPFSGAALTGSNYGGNWKAITTGDFNGDASSDVLLQNTATKAVEIFTVKQNAGDVIGQVNSVTNVTAPAGSGWNPITSGDFNGDGKSDILWQNSLSKAVEVYLTNDSTGATLTTLNTPTAQTASGLTAIGTGDFNGDGTSDILFKNASGQAVIWFMYGDTHTGTKTVAKPGANFSISGAEDVNGNGYSDIVWKDNSGNIAATTFTSPSSLVSTTVMNPNLSLGATPASFSLVASAGGG